MFQKQDRLAALVLLLIVVALFSPYLVQPDSLMWPRSELGTDMLTYNWPSVYFLRQSLEQHGQIPLWQNTSVGGLPMIGNPAIRVFYPPQLLVSLLPIPILWGYALLNVLHFWLAGIGGYGLARAVLKVNFPSALMAGLLVMLTPRLSSNVVGDVGYTHGLCWLPLCLLWTRLALDRLSWRWAIAAGLAVCCIYLNNIQYILYAGWLIGLYFVYRLLWMVIERQPVKVVVQQVGILIVIFVASVGFSAFQSFTFASYLPYQSRDAMTLADANYLALPVPAVVNAFFPIAYKFPEWEIYAGLLPLVLAPLALQHPNRREVVWWLALMVFAVLFSFGSATPLYSLMFRFVPGFDLLRVPARMWYVAALTLVMLAALAVDWLTRDEQRSIPRWVWVSALALSVITIAGRFLTRRPEELDWLLGFPAVAGVLVALVGLRRFQTPTRLAVILSIAALLDLFPLDIAFGRPRPIADFLEPPQIAHAMVDHASESNVERYRVYNVRREILDHQATFHHIQTSEGLNSFQFADYARFMRIATGCNLEGLAAGVPPCVSNEIDSTAYLDAQPNPRLLGLLDVRYVIAPFELPTDEALTVLDTIGDERLYENTAVLPRAFAVGQVEVVDDVWGRLPELDPQKVVLSEQPYDGSQNNFFEPANISLYTPNTIIVQVDMPDAGMLVLGEPFVPGWRAEVDGQSMPVLRVYGALRGVSLDAGTHTVTFRFLPTAFVIGLAVTALTVVAAVVLMARR